MPPSNTQLKLVVFTWQMFSGKALNPFQPPAPSHTPRLHCITYILRTKYKCFSLGVLERCLPDGMDGFLFIRGHLFTGMGFSVACLWGLGFFTPREARASLFCCFCRHCAYPTPLCYTVSWCIFPIPKFSQCRHGIIGFGSHLELNTHKTDPKHFNINWEIDRHVDTITNNQTYSFCTARNRSCRCMTGSPGSSRDRRTLWHAPLACTLAFAIKRPDN